MLLALDCDLNPHLNWDAEVHLEFNHFDVAGNTMPIVVPANDEIAMLRVMPMEPEVTRPIFKLDSDSLLAVSDLLIGDAVRIGRTDSLNPELPFLRDS